MDTKPHVPNELASKLKFVAQYPIRCSVEGQDFAFVPGTEYENLPASDYLYSLWKQGMFEEVKPVKKVKNERV